MRIPGTRIAITYSVFHRILDLKTGLNFYSGPFLFYPPADRRCLRRPTEKALNKITAIEGNTVLLRGIKESILLGETYRAAFLERMKGKMMQ